MGSILSRKESGTAFAPTEDETYFFMDSKHVKLSLLRPSPRKLLNSNEYDTCNKQASNFCEALFGTFDYNILQLLDLKLVQKLRKQVLNQDEIPNEIHYECPADFPFSYFDGKWCCSSKKEKLKPTNDNWAKEWGIKASECDGSTLTSASKCCDGSSTECKNPPCESLQQLTIRNPRSTEIHRHATITLSDQPDIPNSTKTDSATEYRNRRAIPIVAQFAIVIGLAISAYFIGESVAETEIASMEAEIRAQEKALTSLTKAVELDHGTLGTVVNQLRVNPDLVLAPKVTTLSPTYAYMKILATKGATFQHFYGNHISDLCETEASNVENNILQLRNNRLPLEKNFLVAVRAKCLSLQSVDEVLANNFCNDLAFHATRWDTGLKFIGVGFERNNHKQFLSTIYSLSMTIPILHSGGLLEYNIINLGRFQAENVIRKVALPTKAVITAAGDIRPLHDQHCIKMEKYKVCPKGAIAPFSSCLQSIFNGNISSDCPVTDIISPSTCISNLWRDTMAISMFGNGTMHFDLGKSQHLIRPELIDSFTVIQRKETRGTLFCKQSKHRHVSPDLEMPILLKNRMLHGPLPKLEISILILISLNQLQLKSMA